MSVQSKAAQLGKRFGGAWKYDGFAYWREAGGERYVVRTAACSCDYDCGSSPRYFLHDGGKAPVEVEFVGQKHTLCRGHL